MTDLIVRDNNLPQLELEIKFYLGQTAQDFQNHIAPVFRQLYKGCVLVHTETFEDELSKAFDNNAGIDAC